MAEIDITVSSPAVVVDIAQTVSPVTVAATTTPAPVTVEVTTSGAIIADIQTPPPAPITIDISAGATGPAGPSGSGLPWVVITEADYLALATPDAGTIYDIIYP